MGNWRATAVAIGLAGMLAGFIVSCSQQHAATTGVGGATKPVAPATAPATKHRPRFIARGDAVEDTKTGLIWQRDGTASGKLNYYEGQKYAADLRIGRPGWRVPTRAELAAIFPAVDPPFYNTKYNESPYKRGVPDQEWASYWTDDLDTRRDDYAYIYQWYAKGGGNNCYASKNYAYVRCVHDPVK